MLSLQQAIFAGRFLLDVQSDPGSSWSGSVAWSLSIRLQSGVGSACDSTNHAGRCQNASLALNTRRDYDWVARRHSVAVESVGPSSCP